jgi:hypothetical protein
MDVTDFLFSVEPEGIRWEFDNQSAGGLFSAWL